MSTGTDDPLTHAVIGCAMEVHNTLGAGFQEVVYQRALAIELRETGILLRQRNTSTPDVKHRTSPLRDTPVPKPDPARACA